MKLLRTENIELKKENSRLKEQFENRWNMMVNKIKEMVESEGKSTLQPRASGCVASGE